MDIKIIHICEYLRIKPTTGRKLIPTNNGYGYFVYPRVNRADIGVI